MAINYIEKGIELHDAITAAGHWLHGLPNGVWASSNDEAVQAIIDGFVNTPGKLAALAQVYGGKFLAGRTVTVGGIPATYQIDPASIANVQSEGTIAGDVANNTPGAPAWPSDYYWIAADNSHVPMTAAQCFAFAVDVRGYVRDLILRNRALKDAIISCSTQAQLDALDLTAGWPPNA